MKTITVLLAALLLPLNISFGQTVIKNPNIASPYAVPAGPNNAATPEAVDPKKFVSSTVALTLQLTEEGRKIPKNAGFDCCHGTAWFVALNKLATSGHLIEDCGINEVSWVEAKVLWKKNADVDVKKMTVRVRLNEIVEASGENLIVLDLEKPFEGAHPLKISRGGLMKDDNISSVAYVDGELRLATGKFHGMGYPQQRNVNLDLGVFELTDGKRRLTMDHGASGAAILDSHGEVVGIVNSVFSQMIPSLFGEPLRVGSAWGEPTNSGIVLPIIVRKIELPDAQKK